MANPEHLNVLRQGILEWNRWRHRGLKIIPDLSNADLHNFELRGLLTHEVYNAIQNGAKFTGNLLDDYVDGFDFDMVNFRGANLNNTTFEGSDCTNADFQDANLYEAGFHKTNLYRANFQKANLRKAGFPNAKVERANLNEADLRETNFEAVNLREATFRDADLSYARLGGADLFRADFTGANLIGTSLSGANLHKANLCNANLSSASLDFTVLSGTNISHIDLSDASIGQTVFIDIDLSSATGLETVNHIGPSAIGMDTLLRSKGNIPEIFLRRAGVPDAFITYARSLISQPIDFYSCFISYSSKDQNFAERLYADLQSKGVRCWFAPKDLKIGDHYHQRIDESIRLYDKLILILSEHAVQSSWVEREMVAAREKEEREQQPVLFPIRLDDAVMQTTQAWAADVRRRWHIGDFTQWKDHDAYQQAFEQLLRDLKA